MVFYDTHCHLDDSRFDDDLEFVMNNFKENGGAGVIIPGANLDDLPKIASICDRFSDVYFASGAHPYDIENFDIDIVRRYAKYEKCFAIGECGLDYYRLPKDESEKLLEKQKQKSVFISQLDLAVELNLPVILHIRDANEDCFNILKEYGNKLKKGAVVHCYNSSPLLLELCKFGNFYFGIGGVLTFNNSKSLISILPLIPKDRLLLETDGPYLTPVPYRGKRNEPLYIKFVVKKMAEVLNLTEAEVYKITAENTKRFFNCFE